MAKFTIKYFGNDPDETVEADQYRDEGEWITFYRAGEEAGASPVRVLRVRAESVQRIDLVEG